MEFTSARRMPDDLKVADEPDDPVEPDDDPDDDLAEDEMEDAE
jgi:hypothetical protein